MPEKIAKHERDTAGWWGEWERMVAVCGWLNLCAPGQHLKARRKDNVGKLDNEVSVQARKHLLEFSRTIL